LFGIRVNLLRRFEQGLVDRHLLRPVTCSPKVRSVARASSKTSTPAFSTLEKTRPISGGAGK